MDIALRKDLIEIQELIANPPAPRQAPDNRHDHNRNHDYHQHLNGERGGANHNDADDTAARDDNSDCARNHRTRRNKLYRHHYLYQLDDHRTGVASHRRHHNRTATASNLMTASRSHQHLYPANHQHQHQHQLVAAQSTGLRKPALMRKLASSSRPMVIGSSQPVLDAASMGPKGSVSSSRLLQLRVNNLVGCESPDQCNRRPPHHLSSVVSSCGEDDPDEDIDNDDRPSVLTARRRRRVLLSGSGSRLRSNRARRTRRHRHTLGGGITEVAVDVPDTPPPARARVADEHDTHTKPNALVKRGNKAELMLSSRQQRRTRTQTIGGSDLQLVLSGANDLGTKQQKSGFFGRLMAATPSPNLTVTSRARPSSAAAMTSLAAANASHQWQEDLLGPVDEVLDKQDRKQVANGKKAIEKTVIGNKQTKREKQRDDSPEQTSPTDQAHQAPVAAVRSIKPKVSRPSLLIRRPIFSKSLSLLKLRNMMQQKCSPAASSGASCSTVIAENKASDDTCGTSPVAGNGSSGGGRRAERALRAAVSDEMRAPNGNRLLVTRPMAALDDDTQLYAIPRKAKVSLAEHNII